MLFKQGIFYLTLLFLNYIPKQSAYILNTAFDNINLFFYHHHIMLMMITVLIILAIRELYNNYYRKTEHAKKAFIILVIITLVIVLKSLITSWKFIYLLNMPITILITNYLIYIKSIEVRTFLLGLLLVSFFLNSLII